jgi:hypothetical protein
MVGRLRQLNIKLQEMYQDGDEKRVVERPTATQQPVFPGIFPEWEGWI